MRILGIDPGSRVTGFGCVDFDRDRASYVEAGVIRTKGDDFNERLNQIFSGVHQLVDGLEPDAVAIEQVFVARNASSALKLGAARSAAICATFERAPELAEYAPRAIKQAVTGTGAATKEQVAHMVRALLGLKVELTADASDALAVAICHGNSMQLQSKLARMGGRS
ncbi:MAG: crossover junction endodeoxyribonuclease RuvC [Pseudomonadota bacterium]